MIVQVLVCLHACVPCLFMWLPVWVCMFVCWCARLLVFGLVRVGPLCCALYVCCGLVWFVCLVAHPLVCLSRFGLCRFVVYVLRVALCGARIVFAPSRPVAVCVAVSVLVCLCECVFVCGCLLVLCENLFVCVSVCLFVCAPARFVLNLCVLLCVVWIAGVLCVARCRGEVCEPARHCVCWCTSVCACCFVCSCCVFCCRVDCVCRAWLCESLLVCVKCLCVCVCLFCGGPVCLVMRSVGCLCGYARARLVVCLFGWLVGCVCVCVCARVLVCLLARMGCRVCFVVLRCCLVCCACVCEFDGRRVDRRSEWLVGRARMCVCSCGGACVVGWLCLLRPLFACAVDCLVDCSID